MKQSDIESFLEADKDDAELIDGIFSCGYRVGEKDGEKKGRYMGLCAALNTVMKLYTPKEILSNTDAGKIVEALADKFLAAAANDEVPKIHRPDELERATRKVLKNRLRKAKK